MSEARHVLLVEDDLAVHELLAEYLRGRGMGVDTARTSAEARRLLGSRRYHAALVDVQLPDGDGLDVIRQCAGGANPTPAIAMSGLGTVDSAVEALRAGVHDYVVKPFKLRDLYQVIDAAIGKHARTAYDAWQLDALRLVTCAELAETRAEAEACVDPLRDLLARHPDIAEVEVRAERQERARGAESALSQPLGAHRALRVTPPAPGTRAIVLAVHRALVRCGA